MGLALDEPKEDDKKISEGKLTFLVDHYLSNIHDVKIDYQDSWLGKGFVVYTNSYC